MLVLPEDIKHEVKTFRDNIKTKIETHHDRDIDTDMTHGVGQIHTTYDELVRQFGKPILGMSGDGKVRAEWNLLLDDQYVVTIYDWKRPELLEDVTCWNLGSHNYRNYNVQIAMSNMLK